MSALFFGAALLALRSGLRLEYSYLGQRSSFWSVSMKVAVANSSEMKRSNPNSVHIYLVILSIKAKFCSIFRFFLKIFIEKKRNKSKNFQSPLDPFRGRLLIWACLRAPSIWFKSALEWFKTEATESTPKLPSKLLCGWALTKWNQTPSLQNGSVDQSLSKEHLDPVKGVTKIVC